jgi:hypothetical protein
VLASISFSQDIKMNKEVEEIIALGKDSIVQLALNIINKEVGVESFSKITVTTNGKQIYVLFSNSIIYLPLNTVFYTDMGVSLLKNQSFYSPVANPYGYNQDPVPFYKHTEEENRVIQFVLEAINKSDEIGDIDDIENIEGGMIIRENENYYDILAVSEDQESSYKIEKISGRIYDAGHAHLLNEPFSDENEPIFKEVF